MCYFIVSGVPTDGLAPRLYDICISIHNNTQISFMYVVRY